MNRVALDIEEIFYAARERPSPEARVAYLDEVCGADAERRDRVERLLAADPLVDSFLEAPALPSTLPLDVRPVEAPDVVIGPYKLLEPIGEGGMGTVYMAEQTEPVRRCVALKVIKPGMDSKQVIARFEAERQALAMMDHPNIAKVHDGGMTPSGRPYFVMELVRGIPITEYCDREQLSIRDRLDLFVLVCRAVQHAHQKGIIHRDIKPANILVTVIDGAAVPKVIDFGVAKAIGQALTEKTFQTAFAQMIGTPLYMSPEQADFSGVHVDTRSDIYSLGVLLYELLTGTTPFDSETLKRAAFDEMCRIIREDEPPKPSTKIKAEGGRMKDESKTTSQVQALFRRPFSSFIPHPSSFQEVDWIVMKALEKDRARRYETANDFAADVMRYLTDQPVEAGPASAWYRFSKFARRNRLALTVTAAAALGLAVLGGVVAMVAFDRAALRLAAADALAEADRWGGAERRAEELEAVKRAEALLDGGRGGVARLDGVRRRRAALEMALRFEAIQLERAAVRDENFDEALGDRLYAEAFGVIGVDPDTQPSEESARRLPSGPIRTAFVAALDDWARVRRGMSTTADRDRWKRPMAAAAAADSDPWRAAVRAALMTIDLKTLRKLQAEAPRDGLGSSGAILLQCVILDSNVWAVLREAQRRRPDDFWLAHALARHFQTAGPPDLPESLAYYRAALALRPTSPGVLLNFGTALDAAGRHDEALATCRQAIVLKPDYSNAHNNLGKVLAKLGRRREAIAAFREALRLKPDNHATLLNLSRALHENGESAKALALIREALRLRPDDSDALLNLGTILPAAGGDIDEAERALREAIRRRPRDPESFNGLGSLLANHRGRYAAAIEEFRRAIEVAPDYAPAHENLGRCLLSLNDVAAALAAFDEAIRFNPKDGTAHDRRAVALAHLGRLAEAIAAARKALELDPDLATAHQTLGVALGMKADQDAADGPLGALRALAGRPPEIVAELRRAVALDPNNFDARYALGTELLQRGEWTDAAAELAAAARLKPDDPEAHCNLGHALRELGRLDEALAELRRGHELGSKRPGWSYPSADWVAECQALIEKGRTAPARGPVPRE